MNNFIGKYQIKDTKICDHLVCFFDKNKVYGEPGLIYDTDSKNAVLKKDKKDSIDITLSYEKIKNINIFKHYFHNLFQFCSEYQKKYVFCGQTSKWTIWDEVNIQYYPVGGGYNHFHMERFCKEEPISSRHLVFMTYLNTVKSGGQTEFYYQKIRESPIIGKTLIWPADWTHTHRGIPSTKEEKYIITGWFNFVE